MVTLTFEEYSLLRGTMDEDSFTYSLPTALALINYYTFGNFLKLDKLDMTQKTLVARVCDDIKSSSYMTSSSSVSNTGNLISYSNGIESFSFADGETIDKAFQSKIYDLIQMYLAAYPELFSRRVVRYERNRNSSK